MTYTLKQLNPGNYSLRLLANSQAGYGEYSPYIHFIIEESASRTPLEIFLYGFAGVAVVN